MLTPSPRPTSYQPIRIAHGITNAARCAPLPMPKATGIFARKGIAYERKVHRALGYLESHDPGQCIADGLAQRIEHEPWFAFCDANGPGHIVPDFLWHVAAGVHGRCTFVVECKLTFTGEAQAKLQSLYLPVLSAFAGKEDWGRLVPVVICHSLTPQAIGSISRLSSALDLGPGHVGVLQWLGHASLAW